MPSIGDTKVRFGRSYIYLNPLVNGAVAGPGTWRLTSADADGEGHGDDEHALQAQVAADVPSIGESQLIYIDNSGKARPAIATDISTARVAGITLAASTANNFISYITNDTVNITNVSTVIDGVSGSQLTPGTYYFLSSTNAGNLTTTPDTTTTGAVVIQVGIASDFNNLAVEVQQPTVI